MTETHRTEPIRLHCLAGQPASAEIVAHARRLVQWPEPARRRFWDVLGPSLAEPIPKSVAPLYGKYADAHGLDADSLAFALKAARALVRQASALDVPPERFAEDLTALAGGGREIADAILPGYARAKQQIRTEIASRTVVDHGRVLESFRWRLDVLASSDRGIAMKLPVLTLTLHYREGSRREQLSLQVLPHVLEQLRAVCQHVLGRR